MRGSLAQNASYPVEGGGLECTKTIYFSIINFFVSAEVPRLVRSDCFLEPFFRRVRSTRLSFAWVGSPLGVGGQIKRRAEPARGGGG